MQALWVFSCVNVSQRKERVSRKREGILMSAVVIKNLSAYIANGQIEEFLEALEVLLWQYAGDDWSYKFSVEESTTPRL